LLKILHIIPTLAKGGAERLVLDICNQLSKTNQVEVKLVIFRNEVKYDISDYTFQLKVIPSKISLSLIRKAKFEVSELEKFISNYQPNIIHSHLFEAELISRTVTYPYAKWFSHCHDNMIQMRQFSLSTLFNKSYFTNFYEKRYLFKRYKLNQGTQFIAISNHTSHYFNKIQSLYKVTLLHNAIDVNRYTRPSELTKSNSEEIRIVNIGSFVKKKNQAFLLDIILALNIKGILTKTYFLGDGPARIEVEEKAKALGVSDQCFFEGNVNKVEKYLWNSDIYVHTATYEPLGLVLLEAMAAGLPVICLDGKGNRDLMINGKNGYIFQEENSEQFVETIIELFNDQKKYMEISSFAKEFSSQFDIKNYVEKLVHLYKSKCSTSNNSILKNAS
jgi:glycosyltransferase involved in cell wall biosynthesis